MIVSSTFASGLQVYRWSLQPESPAVRRKRWPVNKPKTVCENWSVEKTLKMPASHAKQHKSLSTKLGPIRHAGVSVRAGQCAVSLRTGKFTGESEVLSLHAAQPARFRQHGTPTAYTHKLSAHKLTQGLCQHELAELSGTRPVSLMHQRTPAIAIQSDRLTARHWFIN